VATQVGLLTTGTAGQDHVRIDSHYHIMPDAIRNRAVIYRRALGQPDWPGGPVGDLQPVQPWKGTVGLGQGGGHLGAKSVDEDRRVQRLRSSW
jgi:hypothetical protein